MSDSEYFQEMMRRLDQGDAKAASDIFDMYARRLIGLARKRLTKIVRSKVDPEDIVQSVFRSFFRREADGDFEFSDSNDLWNLLAVITLRKCGQRVEHYFAARRDVKREAAAPKLTSDCVASWQHIARDPTPSEAMVLVETMEELLSSLQDRQRTIMELSLQGMKTEEISERLGCSERTVERTMERVRKKLQRQCRANEESPW